MEPSIAAARAGVTTGEWGEALRSVFGEYRAPTGVGRAQRDTGGDLASVRASVESVSRRLGRRLKFLVGKPGLDGPFGTGRSRSPSVPAIAGMEVVYEGNPPP